LRTDKFLPPKGKNMSTQDSAIPPHVQLIQMATGCWISRVVFTASALKTAGCERIYREQASGARWDRPELHRLLDQLRKADVLVVWKLDRLSRSLRDVLIIMERLAEAKAGFRSLTEATDTIRP
jgi:hypothetical protein